MEGVLFPYEKVKKESRIALYGYKNIMDEIFSYIEEHLNLKGYIFFESYNLDCVDTTFASYVQTLQEMHYEIKNSSMSDSRIGKRKAVLLKKVVD